MNGRVHETFTRRWAIAEGFSEYDADLIARANVTVDRDHSGLLWHNKSWHSAWFGARRKSVRLIAHAHATGDLIALGQALHCIQDSIGHGVVGQFIHWPGIDIWEKRSERIKRQLERETRETLRDFIAASGYEVSVAQLEGARPCADGTIPTG